MPAAAGQARPIRLAHLAGVPAIYYTPLFRRLAQDPRLDFTVIYASSEGLRPFDPKWFGEARTWDADLTSGYRSIFLRAADTTPSLGDRVWQVRNWDIVPTLVRGRYDVLTMAGYHSLTYLMGALTQRALGGQVVFREDQTLLDPRSALNLIAKQLTLRPLFSLGRAMYASRENKRWFQNFGVPDERLFSTPLTVDNDAFQAAARELAPRREEIKREFGIDEGSGPVVLGVARLVPKKQPQFLLEAFRRVRERERCVLLLAGSGPLEDELREQAARDEIPDVVFGGFLNASEIARAYVAGDVFALLSREKETFGLVVNEAMNFGLPVVVSDRVGCASDLVSPGHNGFVVSSRDPAEAAAALERLVRDAGLRERMGRASRERIDSWTVEQTAEGFVAAARDAVS